MKDRFILGSAGGLAGALVMGFLTLILNALPGINIKISVGPSVMFIPKALMGTYQGNFIGNFAALVCGTVLGLILLLLLERTGYYGSLAKGAIFGAFAWFVLCGMMNQGLHLNIQDSLIDDLVSLFVHLSYGITAAYVITRFRQTPAAKPGKGAK